MQRGGRPGLGALAGRVVVFTRGLGRRLRKDKVGRVEGVRTRLGKTFLCPQGGEALSRRPSFCTPSSGCLSISVFPPPSLPVPTLPR